MLRKKIITLSLKSARSREEGTILDINWAVCFFSWATKNMMKEKNKNKN